MGNSQSIYSSQDIHLTFPLENIIKTSSTERYQSASQKKNMKKVNKIKKMQIQKEIYTPKESDPEVQFNHERQQKSESLSTTSTNTQETLLAQFDKGNHLKDNKNLSVRDKIKKMKEIAQKALQQDLMYQKKCEK